MSAKPMVVMLKESSPFAAIFPNGAPVTTLTPVEFALIGSDETRGYLLDLKRCSDEQMTGLARMLAATAGTTLERVLTEILEQKGVPIRASQVKCGPSIPLRFIL